MASACNSGAAAAAAATASECRLKNFVLYETKPKFYFVGSDERSEHFWVLEVDRLKPTVLNVFEDPATYSKDECDDRLRSIRRENLSTGGLTLVTTFCGIIGFVKFLEAYYVLLVTEKRKIGSICGHDVYAVARKIMISLSNGSKRFKKAFRKDEKRYKNLLCSMDLTKDFFFSYSYNIMYNLQNNVCDSETRKVHHESMFVWNSYLSRQTRNNLENTSWIVPLVFGFFHQENLSVYGKDFVFTLIARRSRHYAGTRYLKRGLNEKGMVANDVEIEQIVFEEISKKSLTQITSVVQNRGSIPLFWSQEASWVKIKPDIKLLKKDQNYETTKLHFENLITRYESPVIVLSLIKTREQKHQEAIINEEFENAVDHINRNIPMGNRLIFRHLDLQWHSKRNKRCVLESLHSQTTKAFSATGFFSCHVTPTSDPRHFSREANSMDMCNGNDVDNTRCHFVKITKKQSGILRTNCIDCLDRTNVAQYSYGLVALGHQLYTLGIVRHPKLDLNSSLAFDLVKFYMTMGDRLALQYGGSPAHSKIFSERKGEWKPAIQFREFIKALQRYYSNIWIDADKQNAINLFLGYFQPKQGNPALWDMSSCLHSGEEGHVHNNYNTRASPINSPASNLCAQNIANGMLSEIA